MKVFIPLQAISWTKVKTRIKGNLVGFDPAKRSKKMGNKFIPVFYTEKALREQYPTGEFLEMDL